MRDVKTTVWGLVVALGAASCASPEPSLRELAGRSFGDPHDDAKPLVVRHEATRAWGLRGADEPDANAAGYRGSILCAIPFTGRVGGEAFDGIRIAERALFDHDSLPAEFGDAVVVPFAASEMPSAVADLLWLGDELARSLVDELAAISESSDTDTTVRIPHMLMAQPGDPLMHCGISVRRDDFVTLLERALDDLDALRAR